MKENTWQEWEMFYCCSPSQSHHDIFNEVFNVYLNANTLCLKTVDEEYSLLLIGVHYINASHLIHLGVVENNEMLN